MPNNCMHKYIIFENFRRTQHIVWLIFLEIFIANVWKYCLHGVAWAKEAHQNRQTANLQYAIQANSYLHTYTYICIENQP